MCTRGLSLRFSVWKLWLLLCFKNIWAIVSCLLLTLALSWDCNGKAGTTLVVCVEALLAFSLGEHVWGIRACVKCEVSQRTLEPFSEDSGLFRLTLYRACLFLNDVRPR